MTNPTIVLVHGAFGDASNWRRVFDRLGGDGETVLAPANPLRGIADDAAYLGVVIDQLHTEIDGASHFGVMLSEPDVVAGVIREAALAIAAERVA